MQHSCQVERMDMDVNGHERLSSITLRYKLKHRNNAFIVVLHSQASKVSGHIMCVRDIVFTSFCDLGDNCIVFENFTASIGN